MTKFIQKENFRFKDWIQPGSTISWSQATSEPLTLTEMLVDQRHEVAPLSVFAGTNFSGRVSPLCADSMSFVGMGAVGINRDFLKAGVMEVLPCHLSQIPWMIRSGALKVDALLLQVSVNSNGSFNLGAVSSYLPALIENARTILVEVNEQAPWTFESYILDPSRIDVVLQSDRPMIQIPAKSPQPIDELIARPVKDLIPDGAILQVGIGNLPGAVMRSLRDHKNLGIHSGVIGDKVLIELIETDVVTNAKKN